MMDRKKMDLLSKRKKSTTDEIVAILKLSELSVMDMFEVLMMVERKVKCQAHL